MIQMLNPKLSNQRYQLELEDTARRVLRSGQYILGQEVSDFEEAIAEHIGVKYAVGVSSGTDALILSLMTLGIGPGDEVLCPAFTFFATAGAIARVGATPVFVDVDPETFNISHTSAIMAMTKKTKAIIPVHLFGQSADMKPILDLAKFEGLYVIEDACQSIGATYEGSPVGSMGDVGCFSFFPSKNLGGFGDSGLVTTNNPDLADQLKQMRVHGGHTRYEHKRIGGNFRMDALQAALLNVKLKYLKDDEYQRRQHADYYQLALRHTDAFVLPQEVHGHHVYNQYTLRCKNRSKLVEHLTMNDIGYGIYYPIPLHQQECFNYLPAKSLPNAELLSQECLSIPIAPELKDSELLSIVGALVEFADLQ